MNPKQLKRILLVLGVAVVLWIVAELLGGKTNDMETAFVLPALQLSAVDEVTLTKPSVTLTLRRVEDTVWTVNGHAASFNEVDELFSALADSSRAEMVATGATVHGRMGVDSAQGIFVRFMAGEEVLASVVFGKRGRAYNTRYVRLDGEDFVYQYSGPLAGLVDQNEDDWRNKNIVSIEPDSVGSIVANRGSNRFSLVRGEEGWLLGQNEATDSASVARLLNQYRSLSASGFASEEEADSVEFDRPDARVTLLGIEGDTLTSLVFDSTDAAFWVREEAGGITYRILTWKMNQLFPADSTLRAREEG